MSISKILAVSAVAFGALGFSAVRASAAIVCSEDVCWHTQESYDYPDGANVTVHDDSWHWGPEAHFAWREHDGRGYWHGDQWDTW
jgi:hypothetical protein